MRRSLLCTIAASAALLAGQAGAVTYQVTSIGYSDQSVVGVADINDAGTAILDYGEGDGGAFTYSYPSGSGQAITPPIIPGGGNSAAVFATNINTAGVIVGYDIQTENGVGLVYDFDGFVDNNGAFTFLSVPGSSGGTQLYGINDSGLIWGLYNTANGNGVQKYFTYSGGTYTTLSKSGYSNLTIKGIDNAGDIVGNATVNGQNVGYIDRNGVFSVISDPAGADTAIQAISKNGLIAGHYFSSGKLLGFIYNPTTGTFTSFAPPSGNIVEVEGINNAGAVAYRSGGVDYVYANGVSTNLGPPTDNYDPNNSGGASAINDAGLVAGSYSTSSFSYAYDGFIAAPVGAGPVSGGVPEPGVWSLLIIGVSLTGAALRGRRRTTGFAARA
jgi:hypothetical protein